ncbi:MAG: HD domain-containing protein [Planctomycetota bacterium]|nr:HD domain-containing protein [Planctomycetota bacterium]
MSTEPVATLHYDRVEDVVRTLAASLSNARLYPPRHPRVTEAVRTFVGAVGLFFTAHAGWEWVRIQYGGNVVSHRGVPLGEGGSCKDLMERFEAHDCKGLVFRANIDDESAHTLLDWLLENEQKGFRPTNGVRVLTGRAGEASTMDLEARENLFFKVPELRVPLSVHEGAIDVLDMLMRELRGGRNIDYGSVLDVSERIAAVAMENDTQLLAGMNLPYDDDYTYNHSVNVCMIVTSLIQPFVTGREQLSKVAEAALLHDLGKCRIPGEILNKKAALTSEEFEVIQAHPEYGAQMLLEYAGADPLTVQVAYCHHMRDDEFGYPKPDVPVSPGPIGNLVAVVDMFEALTAKRPYKKSFSVAQALKILLTTQGMETKKPLIRLLFDRLTCFPPGAEVLLDSGERATVVKAFSETPDRPIVKVTEDADGNDVDITVPLDLRLRDGDNGDYLNTIKHVILEPVSSILSA